MFAAGLIAVALLSTVNGCGSTTGNMQDTQSIQGATGVAGGTVQGSGSTGTASDTASQNNGNTADHNAQDNSSGTGTAQNGSNTTDHTAQTGNNDSSGTSQAGVSQHATAGSATMVNGGITEQEAKNIAAGNAGVTEEQIQYITVKRTGMTAVPDMRWNSPQPEWSTIMSWMHPTDASFRRTPK